MTDNEREKKAGAIFEATMDTPTQDRPAAIAAACGGDAELAARVGALLAGARAAEGFLSDPTMDAAAVSEKPGTMIGRYKLLQQIGEGGFGVVFMAEQEKPVRRTVALKVIKLGMDTREVVARFEAERQALAMMDHPNIAKVLDVGATDTGRPYFVMELVKGLPITEYADKKKLSTTERVGLLAQVCRAVQHAHSKGVIHRDLKPSNVLVTTADDKPIPKVIDFGIAKATQSKLTDRTLFTEFRQLIGTPQYMSPEQADSEGVDVDTRTDVYSLGVLLYELLVGTTPLDARQLRSAACEEMRRQIRDVEPPRPSTRLNTLAGVQQNAIATARSSDAKKLGQAIHGELDWIVMRALEKDRVRRYETASAMADDLNRYLAGDAVLAGPVSGSYRLKKTLRRYKVAFAVGSSIAAVLLLGIVGTTYGLVLATHQKAAAETAKNEALVQKAAADEKSSEARATLDFFTNDILAKASSTGNEDFAIRSTLAEALIKPALKTIDQRFQGQPLVRASIRNALANILQSLGRSDLAVPQAKASWDARRQTLGDDHPDTLSAMVCYGNNLNETGRYGKAGEVLKEAIDRCRRALGVSAPLTIDAMADYGTTLNALGRYADAADIWKQAWDRSRGAQGDDDPVTISAMIGYGDALNAMGRLDAAADVFKQAWDRDQRLLGDQPDTIRVMAKYCHVLNALGRHTEAAAVYRPVLDRLDALNADKLKENRGSDHRVDDPNPDSTGAIGQPTPALPTPHADTADLFKLLWDHSRQMVGDDHPATIEAMIDYGDALGDLLRFSDAVDIYRRARDRSRRVLGEDHRDTINAMIGYGVALGALARDREAEPVLQKAVDVLRRVQPDGRNCGLALYHLGQCLASQNKLHEAEAVARETYAWDQAHPGADFKSATAPASLKLLNQILKDQGKPLETTTAPATQTSK